MASINTPVNATDYLKKHREGHLLRTLMEMVLYPERAEHRQSCRQLVNVLTELNKRIDYGH